MRTALFGGPVPDKEKVIAHISYVAAESREFMLDVLNSDSFDIIDCWCYFDTEEGKAFVQIVTVGDQSRARAFLIAYKGFLKDLQRHTKYATIFNGEPNPRIPQT